MLSTTFIISKDDSSLFEKYDRNNKLTNIILEKNLIRNGLDPIMVDIQEINILPVARSMQTCTIEVKYFYRNHKRIILVGAAASGKDYARKLFEDKGYVYATSYTTRPPRDGEVNNKDYVFISNKDFEEKIQSRFWYEYVSFNGWHYGTSKQQFYKDDIFIMTPSGISKISQADRKNCFIMYFDIPKTVRKTRLAQRKMPGDSLNRRLEADELDFENFTTYDIRITNPDF